MMRLLPALLVIAAASAAAAQTCTPLALQRTLTAIPVAEDDAWQVPSAARHVMHRFKQALVSPRNHPPHR